MRKTNFKSYTKNICTSLTVSSKLNFLLSSGLFRFRKKKILKLFAVEIIVNGFNFSF